VAFDPQLIGQLIATPKFQKDFGNAYEDGYIIAAPWQTGLNMGARSVKSLGHSLQAYLWSGLDSKNRLRYATSSL
jgi:hypothetical protein